MAMQIMNFLLDIVWGPFTPVAIIACSLYFSIRTRFVQIRKIKQMWKQLFGSRQKAEHGINGFQSFMISAAARVGTGNIAGVAGAICYGGPGAVFWMCVSALLGAASSFVESTIAQIFKERYENNEFRGGTAYFITKGLRAPWLAVIFTIFAWFTQGFGFHLPNMTSITSSLQASMSIPPIVPTIAAAVLFVLIVFGGVRGIAKFMDGAVPFMSVLYLFMCIVILVLNIGRIPATIALIVNSALNPKSFLGGMMGSAISWGVKRGLYSNEGGMGSSCPAAASSDVEHPAQEGLTQALAVYFDTLVICLIGAVTVIASNSFNVMSDGVALIENLPGVEPGPLFIQSAFAVVFGNLGAILLAICICFFCFTSIVAMHYYAEVNACYLFKNHTKGATLAARIISVIAIFLGGLTYSDLAWSVGDLGLGLMAFVNFPVILILGKYAFAALRDYEEQEKAGVKRFTFDPAKLGIRGADEQMWAELSARAKNQEQI